MLTALTIRNIVLIDDLTLSLGGGLTVLTGETGAGKSIILDALGLALGGRGDGGLVSPGAEQGSVTAVFDILPGARLAALLEKNGIEDKGQLIARRVQGADGRTRAYINDQPVSVQLLREIGAALVEIHGQHDERALLNPDTHRDMLDAYGGLERDVARVGEAWGVVTASKAAVEAHLAALEKSRTERDYLTHAVDELELLSPEIGEDSRLAQTRQLMMHAEKFSQDLAEAHDALSGNHAADARLNAALRKLERNRDKAGGQFDQAIEALERAIMELAEARATVSRAMTEIEYDPQTLETSEERLFALRAAARKYNVSVDDLPGIAASMADTLAKISEDENLAAVLQEKYDTAQADYSRLAEELSTARHEAAVRLDKRVMAELPPLKLEKAKFVTKLARLSEGGPHGLDQAVFKIAANPGQEPGLLMKVASGGELARIILGLKVVLAERGSAPVLVFDEIDTGAGGAVADAIGARLASLSKNLQVIAVTHSPQVAAQALAHMRISKRVDGAGGDERALTGVHTLDGLTRIEEVARMLAGAVITDEARAAAAKLIGGVDDGG